MSTDVKNVIAQKILSALQIMMSIIMFFYIDYDITPIIISLPCIWLLFTSKPILEIFRDEEYEEEEDLDYDYFYFHE